MTVDIHSGGGALANPDDFGNIGLEDIGATDIVIPRLRIVHDEGVFENNLSKERHDKLTVVLLGLVKQRIMWDDDVEDGDKPMCKSPDFEHGFPNVRDDVPKDKRFPWAKSNFDAANFPAEKGLNGLPTLPCSSCVFQQWDKGDWKVPPCAEQHTYPLLYSPDDGDSWSPALFTTQKTGIKPSRKYISSFAQTKTPMFTVFTEMTLTLQSRGSVKYSVPEFKRREGTDRAFWGEYAQQLRTIRDFIRQPPRRFDDEDEDEAVVPSSNENTAPVAEPPAAQPAPAAAAAPAAAPAEDDDLPF